MRVFATILAVMLGSSAALAQGDPRANIEPKQQAAPAAKPDAKPKADAKTEAKPASAKPEPRKPPRAGSVRSVCHSTWVTWPIAPCCTRSVVRLMIGA